jgi:hypothetical protein
MATDRVLGLYLYSVEAYNGDTRVFLETEAAYTKTEEGFLAFKNASHETVLLVNMHHVITAKREHPVNQTPGITPTGYTSDPFGNTSRVPLQETRPDQDQVGVYGLLRRPGGV